MSMGRGGCLGREHRDPHGEATKGERGHWEVHGEQHGETARREKERAQDDA